MITWPPQSTPMTFPLLQVHESLFQLGNAQRPGRDHAPWAALCCPHRTGTTEAQGYYYTLPRRATVNSSPPHSNLGSGRSQQGQGRAQCDTV